MGIPSYYRSLIRRYPKIISGGAGPRAKWLCLDFNCAMYYILGKQPPFPSSSSSSPSSSLKQTQWEHNFRKEICDYLRQLVQIANPTEGVYVGVDGVVCAAKRRQQRLRRFKRPWEENVIATLKKSTEIERETKWDSTALTPGTTFMDQLGKDLCLTGAAIQEETGLDVIVSTASEPGEGEHKLMKQMRSICPDSCTIYGLDADLILLALLLGAETGSQVLLLRETQEFEYRGAGGGFRNLNVIDLGHAITETSTIDENYCRRTRDYVASMSLLGNDFLPKSLTRTVRDSGVESLLEILKKDIWTMNKNLVCPETNQIQTEELRKIIKNWAETEESDMIRAVQAAIAARTRPIRVMDEYDETQRAIEEWKMNPSRWCSIARIWNPISSSLRSEWREIVRTHWGNGDRTPEEYLAGLAWIWDYYNGKPVCQGWVYDCHLPPLWGDLLPVLDASTRPLLEPPEIRYETSLSPWIHLLSVLPEQSVRSLLPDKWKQSLLSTHPWYWPSSWSLFDIGRTQIWECEPVIPLIPEALLRKIDRDESQSNLL